MIGGTTNEDYLVKATVKNLEGISIAKKYLTDVRLVEEPDFGVDDTRDAIMESQEGASLFVWGIGSSESTEGNHIGSTFDKLILTLAIVGVVKQAEKPQSAIRRLAADVRRVMRENARRNFDGGTGTNIYCENTAPSSQPTFDYLFGKIDAATTVALFYTAWDATYRFPLATG